MLGSEAPCADSPAVVVAVTRGLDAFSRSCADGSATPVSSWLDDASPMELDVTDAASVQAVLDRVAASTDGQVTSMMLVENGEAKMPDGSPRTYSDLQLGVVLDPQTVLDVRVQAPGAISGNLRASEDSNDLLQISEIDVNGLLECSVELRSRTGATGGSVYVAKGYGGGPIEYQWREVGVEGVYTTDTNCQQI